METFRDFFNEGSKKSMTRLIVFVLIWAAVVMILGGIGLAFVEKLDLVYVGFTTTIVSAALGAKNWAKNIESKKPTEKKDEG